MTKRKVAATAIGCKVNQYDAAAMLALFYDAGYETVAFDSIADIYIISTCTVTAMADKKSRQMLNRAKKQNPNAIICAAGCLSQKDGEKLKNTCDVDVVIGNMDRQDIVDIVEDTLVSKSGQTRVRAIRNETIYENLNLHSPTEKTRAFIKIQEGCDNFCAYCIIPYVRGKARSRPLQAVVDEVTAVVNRGVLEVVLTGIHVSSYGVDFDDGTDLITLLSALNNIDGLKRLRLGSLEPLLITREFCEAAAEIKSLCPHFHLSLQSGSETVLKRMNRKYTPEDYKSAVDLLREYFDNPAITTDIIVGFPGETEEAFNETVAFANEVEFSKLHVFPYSIREGTKAATMSGQLSRQIKKQRVNALMNLDEELQQAFAERFIGQTVSVLFEEKNPQLSGHFTGYTTRYVPVSAPARENIIKGIQIKKVENQIAFGD